MNNIILYSSCLQNLLVISNVRHRISLATMHMHACTGPSEINCENGQIISSLSLLVSSLYVATTHIINGYSLHTLITICAFAQSLSNLVSHIGSLVARPFTNEYYIVVIDTCIVTITLLICSDLCP